jgi:hypothetical protein
MRSMIPSLTPCRCRTDSPLVLHKSSKPIEIEIQNVTRFSYGELTDGQFAIWAEGKAGWFEIRPASHYTAIYADMIQAVQLLYFVTDIYNEPRKRGGGPSPQLIFQEVSFRGRCACSSKYYVCPRWEREFVVLTCASIRKMSDSHAPTLRLQKPFSGSITSFC